MIFTIPTRGHYILTKPWNVDLQPTLEAQIEYEKQQRINYAWRYTGSNAYFDEIAYRINFFRSHLEGCIRDDGYRQTGEFALEVPVGLVYNLKRLQLSTQKHTVIVDVHPKYNKIKHHYEVERMFNLVDDLKLEVEYIDDPAELRLIAKDKAIWMKQKGF